MLLSQTAGQLFRYAGIFGRCLVCVLSCSMLQYRKSRRTQLHSESINPSWREVMKLHT